MWRKLVTLMRFDGPGAKPNPLKPRPAPDTSPLAEAAFEPNPGNLRMFQYLPEGLKRGAPLVVTLHGCGQTAGGYDLGYALHVHHFKSRTGAREQCRLALGLSIHDACAQQAGAFAHNSWRSDLFRPRAGGD